MQNRTAILAGLVILALSSWPHGPVWARDKGPSLLVVTAARAKGHDLKVVSLRRRRKARFVTFDGKDKVGLQCLGDGKTLLYVSQGRVYDLDVTATGKTLSRVLARLPSALVRGVGDGVGRFLSVSTSGRFVAVPHAKGIYLVDRTTGKGRLIEPSCRIGDKGRATRTTVRCSEGSQVRDHISRRSLRPRLVFLHPVFWAFKQHRFVFVAMRIERCPGGTTSGGRTDGGGVPVEVMAGLYDVDRGKTLSCARLARRMKGPVSGLDLSWRDDGRAFALSVESPGSGRLHRVVTLRDSKGEMSMEVHRVKALSVGRFHGWRGNWLTATARRGRLVGLWRWKPGSRRRPVRIRALAPSQRVTVYEPSLRTFLLEVSGRKGCDRTRLLQVRRERSSRSLFRWAMWSRLVTRDWSGRWGLFQAGAGCGRGKVRAVVSRLDGRRVLWTSRRMVRLGRRVEPGRAALCSAAR